MNHVFSIFFDHELLNMVKGWGLMVLIVGGALLLARLSGQDKQ